MDPNANLAEMRHLAASLLARFDQMPGDIPGGIRDTDVDAARLAELAEALDNWLSKGGFLPRAWQDGR